MYNVWIQPTETQLEFFLNKYNLSFSRPGLGSRPVFNKLSKSKQKSYILALTEAFGFALLEVCSYQPILSSNVKETILFSINNNTIHPTKVRIKNVDLLKNLPTVRKIQPQ